MKFKRNCKIIRKPNIDGIQFDSGEESEIYEKLRDGVLGDFTGIKILNKYKLLDARPKGIMLYDKFKAGIYLQRARTYKRDFTCEYKKEIIHLEYKSIWSEKKPDYRLRRFLVLLSGKLRFAELVKLRKGIFEYKEYF